MSNELLSCLSFVITRFDRAERWDLVRELEDNEYYTRIPQSDFHYRMVCVTDPFRGNQCFPFLQHHQVFFYNVTRLLVTWQIARLLIPPSCTTKQMPLKFRIRDLFPGTAYLGGISFPTIFQGTSRLPSLRKCTAQVRSCSSKPL